MLSFIRVAMVTVSLHRNRTATKTTGLQRNHSLGLTVSHLGWINVSAHPPRKTNCIWLLFLQDARVNCIIVSSYTFISSLHEDQTSLPTCNVTYSTHDPPLRILSFFPACIDFGFSHITCQWVKDRTDVLFRPSAGKRHGTSHQVIVQLLIAVWKGKKWMLLAPGMCLHPHHTSLVLLQFSSPYSPFSYTDMLSTYLLSVVFPGT